MIGRPSTLLWIFLLLDLLTASTCHSPAVAGDKTGNSATRVAEHHFHSRALRKEAYFRVMWPMGYPSSDQDFPVLYLLHGYSGDYTNWFELAPGITDLSDAEDMFIVTPDGGYDSWYVDSPRRDSGQYETFLIKELIPFIDSLYPTKAGRENRAISGLSMGGHGAFLLAARNPNLFGAAGSMSGAFDLEGMQHLGYDLEEVLGPREPGLSFWQRHTTYHLLDSFDRHQMAITLDCGMSDDLWSHSLEMHKMLLADSISHSFRNLPGAHNWSYWRMAIPGQLAFFRLFFEKA